jgi:hypothetical protein
VLVVHGDTIVARTPTGERRDDPEPWRSRYSGWKAEVDVRSLPRSAGRLDLYVVVGRGHELCRFGDTTVPPGVRG